jgi:hypothetical protein
MRDISFMETGKQIKNRTKTVTRRLGWKFLKPGTFLRAVDKLARFSQGPKPRQLAIIRVMSVRRERLDAITVMDVRKEGFPDETPDEFIREFATARKCRPRDLVTRIEFAYCEPEPRAK